MVKAFRDELELRLVDAPDTNEPAELVPVQVPERVSRFHAAARVFRDRTERHEVSRTQLQRAIRIVHAIATEAERRGWAASAGTESENGYGRTSWTAPKDGHIQIMARDNQFLIRVQEEGVHTRGPWEAEVHRYRNVGRGYLLYGDREAPSGPYDANATGRLRLELYFRHKGRQSRWSDRSSWTLEERLPHLFREIEERIVDAARVAEERRVAAEEAAEAARREAEERERQWHVLMDEARRRLVETHRTSQLLAQAQAWNQADQLRRYCDALAAAHGDNPKTAAWLTWAREYAARLDPLTEPPGMPESPEATPEALQDHLPGGWSAHGPEHGHRATYWR
ncbi:MAG TPA: hypothetical protein VN635_01440 [Conexibacter sp.]|nr:hypothetical protein [Conexibacter sp.]